MIDVYSWDNGMGKRTPDNVAEMFINHMLEVHTNGRTDTYSKDLAELMMYVSERLGLGYKMKKDVDAFDDDEFFWIMK